MGVQGRVGAALRARPTTFSAPLLHPLPTLSPSDTRYQTVISCYVAGPAFRTRSGSLICGAVLIVLQLVTGAWQAFPPHSDNIHYHRRHLTRGGEGRGRDARGEEEGMRGEKDGQERGGRETRPGNYTGERAIHPCRVGCGQPSARRAGLSSTNMQMISMKINK